MGSINVLFPLSSLKGFFWLLVTSFWIVAVVSKSSRILSLNHWSVMELGQILSVTLFLIGWLFLKPACPTTVPAKVSLSSR